MPRPGPPEVPQAYFNGLAVILQPEGDLEMTPKMLPEFWTSNDRARQGLVCVGATERREWIEETPFCSSERYIPPGGSGRPPDRWLLIVPYWVVGFVYTSEWNTYERRREVRYRERFHYALRTGCELMQNTSIAAAACLEKYRSFA